MIMVSNLHPWEVFFSILEFESGPFLKFMALWHSLYAEWVGDTSIEYILAKSVFFGAFEEIDDGISPTAGNSQAYTCS